MQYNSENINIKHNLAYINALNLAQEVVIEAQNHPTQEVVIEGNKNSAIVIEDNKNKKSTIDIIGEKYLNFYKMKTDITFKIINISVILINFIIIIQMILVWLKFHLY